MATKKAKTAIKGGAAAEKPKCPQCQAERRITRYAGYGPRGLFWVCEKNCGYLERTH